MSALIAYSLDMVNIPCIGRATAGVGLSADIGVLVFIPDIKAQVVDYISGVFHDIGALAQFTDSRLAAQVLELDDEIGVGCGREASEDTLMSKQEGPRADRQQCALASGVRLLDLSEGQDQIKGLALVFDDLLDIAAENDEDVEVRQAVMGLLPGDLRSNNDALLGEDFRFASGNGDFESPGHCNPPR